jgi:hypothetical protein
VKTHDKNGASSEIYETAAECGVLASAYSDRDLLQARESSLNSPLKPFDLKTWSQVRETGFLTNIFFRVWETNKFWQNLQV